MNAPAYDVALHLTGIGSSSAAACAGVSPYRTQLEEYQRFVHAIEAGPRAAANESNIDPEKAFFGHAMEPVIARAFERETGLRVRRNAKTFRSKAHPHLIATPDSFILGQRAILEFKTAGLRTIRMWGEEGTDEVPMHYLIQVAHQMAVVDYDKAQLAVLLGANDLRIYRIDRDAELEKLMLERLADFWRRVQERDPPPPTSLDDCDLRWPQDNGKQIVATPEISKAIEELRILRGTLKAYGANEEELELQVKVFMGEHAEILLDREGKTLSTWKTQSAKRLDSKRLQAEQPAVYEAYLKASTSRVFRLKGT